MLKQHPDGEKLKRIRLSATDVETALPKELAKPKAAVFSNELQQREVSKGLAKVSMKFGSLLVIFELSCRKEDPHGGRRSSKHGNLKYFEPLRGEMSPPIDCLDQTKDTQWPARSIMKEAVEGCPFSVYVFDDDLTKCN